MNPQFDILSPVSLYSNALTPLKLKAIISNDLNNNYFLWNLGDGSFKTGEEIEYVYTEPGEYKVSLTQYDFSGNTKTSDIITVTVFNLIPNLMDWADDSFNANSTLASTKNSIPFKIKIYNSWQWDNDETDISFHAENSKSIPFDNNDPRIHLKPTWRFLNTEDEIVKNIKISNKKIYGTYINNKIFLSELQTDDSVFVGLSSETEFYFIDDTPSGINPDIDYLPSTIIVSQNLSSIFSDKNISKTSEYLQYPSLIKSIFIENIIPNKLEITSNGVFDIFTIQHSNTQIPFTIRIVDQNDNYIKTNPVDSSLVGSYPLNIGFSKSLDVDAQFLSSFQTIEKYKFDFSNFGGFYESSFIPLESSLEYVTLTASSALDYTLNKAFTRFGVFSDEKSNKIYRISYIDGFDISITDKVSSSMHPIIDGDFYSNKYGSTIDISLNSLFLDSDASTLEIYDISFQHMDTIDLSIYSDNISGHSSPVQITHTQNGQQLITLYDSGKILFRNSLGEISILFSESLSSDSGINCIDILADGVKTYVGFVDIINNQNELRIFDFNESTPNLSPISVINLGDEVPIDIVSNRTGDRLFLLTENYYTRECFIKRINTTNNNILNNYNIGFGSEGISIDENQYAWSYSSSTINSPFNNLVKISDNLEYINLSSYGGETANIGGITGDSYGNVWYINGDKKNVYIIDSESKQTVNVINILADSSREVKYNTYGDWNGYRWYNKFGFNPFIITYSLYGESKPFKIYPKNYYNLQKINENFDMTETVKSYRTTEAMLNYDDLFDNFLGSIYGNKLDDGTFFGKNVYEKIANFVMNNVDVDTCNINAIESLCAETGIDIEAFPNFPRDIHKLINLFSISYKKIWGDVYSHGVIEEYKGDFIDIATYTVSADPQVKFIATEKFNAFNTIITPLIVDSDTIYPLSSYNSSWGWGLSVPEGGKLENYYEFYEFNPPPQDQLISVIDWKNDLTKDNILPLSSYSNYMTDDGIVSVMLSEKLKEGLGLFINN